MPKVKCGPSPKPEVKSAPKVKSEPPQLQVVKVPSEPKVKSEPNGKRGPRVVFRMKKSKAKTGGAFSKVAKQWHCDFCGKNISCSNKAKHMKRIHPRSYTGKRGRPKVPRGCVDLD